MNQDILYSISQIMPSVKQYITKSLITQSQQDKINNIIRVFITGQFKDALNNTTPQYQWMHIQSDLLRTKYSIDIINESICTLINVPHKNNYYIYDAILDLDSSIYYILHPFPKHLEKSPSELTEIAEVISKPFRQ